jgi:PucR C-terminal helix-turn-helix domain
VVDVQVGLDARQEILAALVRDTRSLVDAVATDVGETRDAVRPAVELTLRLLLEQPGLTKGRAVMRAAGAQAARDGIPAERFLQRFTSTTWLVWEGARGHPAADRVVLEMLGETLLRGIDLLVGAVADGYNAVDRESVAHDAEMRRALLEDLLSTAPPDPVSAARRRRLADRYGLDPDAAYRVIAASDARDDADMPLDDVAHVLSRRLRRPARAGRSRTAFPLPQVLAWRGLVVVLATASWPAATKLPVHLAELLGPRWVAVAGDAVQGVEGIAATMGRLTLSLRTGVRIGRRGWIDGPDELALEELVTIDDDLLDAVVERELGAILGDPRMGPELLETLEVYFDSGQNMRETGRRLHLAPRTVAYRLERVARLIDHPLDGPTCRRLTIALFAYRMRRPPTA